MRTCALQRGKAPLQENRRRPVQRPLSLSVCLIAIASCAVWQRGGSLDRSTQAASFPRLFGHGAKEGSAGPYAAVVDEAIKQATALMDEDVKILEAEAVLAKALDKLHHGRTGRRKLPHVHFPSKLRMQANTSSANHSGLIQEATEQLESSDVYVEVKRRVDQYDSVRDVLDTSANQFKVCWEKPNATMFIHCPRGQTWFEFRLVAELDAPLHHCLAAMYESDLIPKYQPDFVRPHHPVGVQKRHLIAMQTLTKILSFHVEVVFEVLRVSNLEFGFLIERVLSDFPKESRPKPPPASRWARRAGVDTKNIWFPQGGGLAGTVLVMVSKVHIGVPIPEYVLNHVLNSMAPRILGNIRRGCALASESGSEWATRVAKDKDGVYAEWRAVEEASSRRESISKDSLPSASIFDRQWQLSA